MTTKMTMMTIKTTMMTMCSCVTPFYVPAWQISRAYAHHRRYRRYCCRRPRRRAGLCAPPRAPPPTSPPPHLRDSAWQQVTAPLQLI
jgi:hypothetical protein